MDQKEIAHVNDLKLKVQLAITNVKHKMVKDATEFGNNVSVAKQKIGDNQAVILSSIRESIESTCKMSEALFLKGKEDSKNSDELAQRPAMTENEKGNIKKREIENILLDTGMDR